MGWQESRQRQEAIARHRAQVVQEAWPTYKGGSGGFDKAKHLRGRGGQFIDMPDGPVRDTLSAGAKPESTFDPMAAAAEVRDRLARRHAAETQRSTDREEAARSEDYMKARRAILSDDAMPKPAQITAVTRAARAEASVRARGDRQHAEDTARRVARTAARAADIKAEHERNPDAWQDKSLSRMDAVNLLADMIIGREGLGALDALNARRRAAVRVDEHRAQERAKARQALVPARAPLHGADGDSLSRTMRSADRAQRGVHDPEAMTDEQRAKVLSAYAARQADPLPVGTVIEVPSFLSGDPERMRVVRIERDVETSLDVATQRRKVEDMIHLEDADGGGHTMSVPLSDALPGKVLSRPLDAREQASLDRVSAVPTADLLAKREVPRGTPDPEAMRREVTRQANASTGGEPIPDVHFNQTRHATTSDPIVKGVMAALGSKLRHADITPATAVRLQGTHWDEGQIHKWTAVRLSDMATVPIPRSPWQAGPGQSDPVAEIPEGIAMVDNRIGHRETVTIYVNPGSLTPMLSDEKLSDDVARMLSVTASLKNTYAGETDLRFRTVSKRTGMTRDQWEAAQAWAKAKKYLTKSGSITQDGRNAIANHPLRREF